MGFDGRTLGADSVKSFISGYDIANTVRMAHSQVRSTFLLVEGSTDVLFFRRFVDLSRCEILPCHGRERALDATSILDEAHEAGFLTFVDADWDRLTGRTPSSANCILSDGHDLIVDLLSSEALNRLLAERGSREKIERFEAETGTSVLDALLEAAATLGRLRWHSHESGLNLVFADLNVQAYADEDSFRIDLVRVVGVVVQRTGSAVRQQDLHTRCDELAASGFDVRQVAVGHDGVALLSLALRSRLGSQRAIDVKVETLELELRLAFDEACLRRKTFYQKIRDWEERNPDWPVFRNAAAA